MLAELVREQVLHRTRQEVPHAVEVQVDEIHEQEEIVVVHAFLWVETESQKGILIGAHGRMIKSIGIAARREIERELGKRVHLDLSVRVRRSWRGDERCSTGSASREDGVRDGRVGVHRLAADRAAGGRRLGVRALARSDAAAERVTAAGAEPVRGDLGDAAALERGARGAEVTFHVAAKAEDWGAWEDFRRVNVEGTKAVLAASRAAGVRRVVHVGTEAALMHGQPLVHADERTPLALSSKAPYPATKAAAEAAVVAAGGVETVVIRPRFVWGPGDTTLLPVLIELVRRGRFRWIGGGRQRDLDHPPRQRRRGARAGRRPRHARRRVLRHRRRAGRVPRVRDRAARHARRRRARRQHPATAGRRRGGGRGDGLARAPAPGFAAGDALRRLGQRARVHARRLARPRRARLRAGE